MALFAEDGCDVVGAGAATVQLRLSQLRLCRPRQWGACWLAGQLWNELQLNHFWSNRLTPSRKGTRWDEILQVLVCYRLIAPGSEWRLHREWFGNCAMADLLGGDFALAEAHKLYACHDLLLEHKEALFSHLVDRWRDLFNVEFDVLLYDLTSTYVAAQRFSQRRSADAPSTFEKSGLAASTHGSSVLHDRPSWLTAQL